MLADKQTTILGDGNDIGQCLNISVLNKFRQVPWSINEELLPFLHDTLKPSEKELTATENKLRINAYKIRNQETDEVIDYLLENGNKFWFDWKYDSRGRSYSQGYHINIQANEYRKAMLEFAYHYNEGPISIRYPRGSVYEEERDIPPIALGKFEIIEKGDDILMLYIGNLYEMSSKIKENLEKYFNKKIWLVNARFLKPLDKKFLDDIKKDVKTVITLEENVLNGGFGSSIAMYYSANDIKVFSFGLPNEFITHGKTSVLKEHIGFTAKDISERLKKALEK